MMLHKKLDLMLMGIGTICIICFYLILIPKIYTVWNLVDEYGYLANAAHLSGTGWTAMTNFYYGYGYSLWLIPLFWFCNSGLSIIRGAMIMNTIFIVLLFWVQYLLMSKLYKELDSRIIAVLSFVLCFYPYLAASNWKVISECLLTLMIWVCGLLLYQALDSEKWYWYACLGIAVAYTFFVHTRSFVFLLILMLAVCVMFCQKKITIKNMFVFLAIGVLLLVLGTLLKNHIIDVMYTNVPGQIATDDIGNTLTLSYVWDRLTGFLTELSFRDVDSFACKVFYLFVGTAGLLPFGIYVIVRNSIKEWKAEKCLTKEAVIQLMYAVSVLGMVIALVVNPMGADEGTGHYFYARYYEYLMGPVIFGGAGYCMTQKIRIREIVGMIGILLFFGWFAADTAVYLDTQELYIGIGYMPALSFILQFVNWFTKVIEIGMSVTIAVMVLLFVITQFTKLRKGVPVLLLVLFMMSNIWNMITILKINRDNKVEYQIAEHILENYTTDEVVFLDDGTNATVAYTKIQCLLGGVKVKVVDKENTELIQYGDLVVSLQFNPYIEELTGAEMVLKQGCYEVYIVNELTDKAFID